jgi:hypothetical protein
MTVMPLRHCLLLAALIASMPAAAQDDPIPPDRVRMALEAWHGCATNVATSLAKLVPSESAELIIEAAFIECRPQEITFDEAMQRKGEALTFRHGLIETTRKTMRDRLLPVVIRAKAAP